MTMQAEQLIGAQVTGGDGQVVGTVQQIFNDDRDGTPVWARIRAGTGERFVPLAGSKVTKNGLSVPYDAKQIMSSPDIGADRHMSAAQTEQLKSHFGLSVPAQGGPPDADTRRRQAPQDEAGRGRDRGGQAPQDEAGRGRDRGGQAPQDEARRGQQGQGSQTLQDEAGRGQGRGGQAPQGEGQIGQPQQGQGMQQQTQADPAQAGQAPQDEAQAGQRGGRAARDETERGRGQAGQPAADEAVPDQATPDQASPDQASPDQASPDQASPDQASPDQGMRDKAARGDAARDDALQGAGQRGETSRGEAEAQAGEEWLIRAEEQLNVGTETVETGRARLHKYVDVEPVEQAVHVFHEEYEIERVPIAAEEQISGVIGEEGVQEIILHEERAVFRKEAVPVERVRLVVKRVGEDRTVRDEIRKERVEVEADGGREGQPAGQAPDSQRRR